MSKNHIGILVILLLLTMTTSGCALGLIEQALGDNVATHDDDQSTEGGNQGNFK